MKYFKAKYFYYFIIFFIIINLINSEYKKEHYAESLYNNARKYRLGDIVLGMYLKDKEYHLKKFPNSIATEYIKRTNKPKQFDILKNIISKKKLKKKFNNTKDACIVHIRVGDVIEWDKWTVKEFLEKERKYKSGKKYVKPKSYFIDKIKKLKKLNVKNVIFIAGSHYYLPDFSKSYKYLDEIKKLFENNKINVKTLYGNNPDDDVLIAHNAKYFIGTSGGYGRLLGLITKGQII